MAASGHDLKLPLLQNMDFVKNPQAYEQTFGPGITAAEAAAKAQALALRALAERLEHGEVRPFDIRFSVPAGV